MKVLVMISHPAHFHMFRYMMENLIKDGHEVVPVIRPKDMLEQLCIDAGLKFYKVKDRPKKGGIIGLGLFLIEKVFEVTKITKKEKPDMLIGSDGVVAYAGVLTHRTALEFFEDDYEVITLYMKMFFPFYNHVICPHVCSAGKWEYKKVSYPGYQKLAYLYPSRFTPDINVVHKYFDTDTPYFILRFAQLTAHHDVGMGGFTLDVAQKVIDMLKPHGRVYITSEKPLAPQFEQYRLKIDPLDIHHVLAYATLYMGDSQSMAVEASMLGTPCIRFNDFVGAKKIRVLEELEHEYHLTFGISSHEPETLYKRVEELLAMPNLKAEWARRREKMLGDKIDVTKFFTWFIENYPKSAQEAKEGKDNKDFWKKFK